MGSIHGVVGSCFMAERMPGLGRYKDQYIGRGEIIVGVNCVYTERCSDASLIRTFPCWRCRYQSGRLLCIPTRTSSIYCDMAVLGQENRFLMLKLHPLNGLSFLRQDNCRQRLCLECAGFTATVFMSVFLAFPAQVNGCTLPRLE